MAFKDSDSNSESKGTPKSEYRNPRNLLSILMEDTYSDITAIAVRGSGGTAKYPGLSFPCPFHRVADYDQKCRAVLVFRVWAGILYAAWK
jgi:hypothetical protein